jgi:hypothetical protein
MMKIVLTLCIASLLQSLCFAQNVTNIDWEFRANGDTVVKYYVDTRIIDDSLNFKRGSIVQLDANNNIDFISHSTRKGSILPSTTYYKFKTTSEPLSVFHTRIMRLSVMNRNNFRYEQIKNYGVNLYIDYKIINGSENVGNLVLSYGWDLDNPIDIKVTNLLPFTQNPNVAVLSKFTIFDASVDSLVTKCFAVSFVRNAEMKPIVSEYVVSENSLDRSFRKKELSPLTMQPFTPIAHSYSQSTTTHFLLFGNPIRTMFAESGFDIVLVDTSLTEIKKVHVDSIQMQYSNGRVYPTNLYSTNDKIFVTGYIDFGTMQYPFYSEHSSNGDFIKSQIVNTNSTIHSGSVSPDGKTVMLCGSVMNANDNKDFFVVAINTETGTHTQQTWGDNRENELFDVLAISKDTAYVTGSEDKDFYAGRLVNLQTMSVGEQTTFGNIEISPNPASSMCTITTRNLISTHSTMTIQNMQGQTVATIFKGIPSSTEVQNISIEHLPMGAYFVTVQNGHTIHKTKFVIQR